MDKNVNIKVPDYQYEIDKDEVVKAKIEIEGIPSNQMECYINKQSQYGTCIVINNGDWTYMPNEGFVGNDEFDVNIYYLGKLLGVSHILIKVIQISPIYDKSKVVEIENIIQLKYKSENIIIKNIILEVTIDKSKLTKKNNKAFYSLIGTIKYIIYYCYNCKKTCINNYSRGEEIFHCNSITKCTSENNFCTYFVFENTNVKEEDIIIDTEIIFQDYNMICGTNNIYHYLGLMIKYELKNNIKS